MDTEKTIENLNKIVAELKMKTEKTLDEWKKTLPEPEFIGIKEWKKRNQDKLLYK